MSCYKVLTGAAMISQYWQKNNCQQPWWSIHRLSYFSSKSTKYPTEFQPLMWGFECQVQSNSLVSCWLAELIYKDKPALIMSSVRSRQTECVADFRLALAFRFTEAGVNFWTFSDSFDTPFAAFVNDCELRKLIEACAWMKLNWVFYCMQMM